MNYANVNTPWGKSQHGHSHLPGMTSYSTAGHGGIKLVKDLNRRIPLAFRNLDGWYEEDCDAQIVYYFLYDLIVGYTMTHQAAKLDGYSVTPLEFWADFPKERFGRMLRDWNPAAWSIHFDVDMEPEIRAHATQQYTAHPQNYDQSKVPGWIEDAAAAYHKSRAAILAKREPVPLFPGDVVPLDHPDIPRLTVESVKPLCGRDHTGKLWKIPKRLIQWALMPNCPDPFSKPKAATLPASRTATLLLSSL